MFASPSWLLLLWAGLAATLVTAAVLAPLAGSDAPRGSLLFFRPTGWTDGLLLLLLGVLVYPTIFGVVFDVTHLATAISGALTGLAAAAVLFIVTAIQRRGLRSPLMTLMLYVVYGAVLGFLYVTP